MKLNITPTRNEVTLGPEEIIVTKTDLTGRITYANRVFMRLADFSESDLLGKQHNVVRHPDMPRGAFKLLWDTLRQNREFFGFVKNMTANGDYYWVFANVTPDFNTQGECVGYFSVRRRPSAQAISNIQPIYNEMLAIENRSSTANAPTASVEFLMQKLRSLDTTYDRFILSLMQE